MIYLLLIPLIFTAVFSDICYKKTKASSTAIMFGIAFWSVLICSGIFLVSLFFNKDPFAGFSWTVFAFILLYCVLTSVIIWTYCQAIKNTPLSFIKPIKNIQILILLAFSWIVFGDIVTVADIVLSSVIFVLCVLLGIIEYRNTKKSDLISAKQLLKGLFWIGLCILAIVGKVFCIKMIGETITIFTLTFVNSIILFMIAILTLLITKQQIKESFRACFQDNWLIGAGLSDNSNAILYISLAISMNLGVLDAISQVATVLIALVGVLIFREKLGKWSYFIIVAILGCAIALSLLQ